MVLLAAGWTEMSANDPLGNFLSSRKLMRSDLGWQEQRLRKRPNFEEIKISRTWWLQFVGFVHYLLSRYVRSPCCMFISTMIEELHVQCVNSIYHPCSVEPTIQVWAQGRRGGIPGWLEDSIRAGGVPQTSDQLMRATIIPVDLEQHFT